MATHQPNVVYWSCGREFKSSQLTLVQFTKVFHTMGVQDDRVIRSMFEAWDRDRDGSVDFSELLNGAMSLCRYIRCVQRPTKCLCSDRNHRRWLS